MGETFLLPAIAAVVIGGTSILGGSGKYVGTIAGVILIRLLDSALNIVQVACCFAPIMASKSRNKSVNEFRVDRRVYSSKTQHFLVVI
jgi:predicted ABC-type sugar transport system permease subunit